MAQKHGRGKLLTPGWPGSRERKAAATKVTLYVFWPPSCEQLTARSAMNLPIDQSTEKSNPPMIQLPFKNFISDHMGHLGDILGLNHKCDFCDWFLSKFFCVLTCINILPHFMAECGSCVHWPHSLSICWTLGLFHLWGIWRLFKIVPFISYCFQGVPLFHKYFKCIFRCIWVLFHYI